MAACSSALCSIFWRFTRGLPERSSTMASGQNQCIFLSAFSLEHSSMRAWSGTRRSGGRHSMPNAAKISSSDSHGMTWPCQILSCAARRLPGLWSAFRLLSLMALQSLCSDRCRPMWMACCRITRLKCPLPVKWTRAKGNSDRCHILMSIRRLGPDRSGQHTPKNVTDGWPGSSGCGMPPWTAFPLSGSDMLSVSTMNPSPDKLSRIRCTSVPTSRSSVRVTSMSMSPRCVSPRLWLPHSSRCSSPGKSSAAFSHTRW
mmetsp:Transcript_34766/g.100119  ORF Transcript_34766/g.100119 Transcript_34766/m.100119 type:complete len:258 (+) Transcript_34766:622-1395(+)